MCLMRTEKSGPGIPHRARPNPYKRTENYTMNDTPSTTRSTRRRVQAQVTWSEMGFLDLGDPNRKVEQIRKEIANGEREPLVPGSSVMVKKRGVSEALETREMRIETEADRAEIRMLANRLARERLSGQDVAEDFQPTDLSDDGDDEPPPDVLAHPLGVGLFYRGATNELIGDPESGKTWIALAACVEVMRAGGTAHYIDLDHNGRRRIKSHLIYLGADPECILERFTLWEPQSPEQVNKVVQVIVTTPPDLVVMDSIGELLPLFDAKINDADDYTRVHTRVLKPMAAAGVCVVSIDHLSKGADSRAYGATGSIAKKRAVRGASLFVELDGVAYKPGAGGRSRLTINKDAGGGLRAVAADGRRLGSFVLGADGGWSFGETVAQTTAQAASDSLRDALLSIVEETPGLNGVQIKERAQGLAGRAAIDQALRAMCADDVLHTRKGKNNASFYYPVSEDAGDAL